MCVCVYVLVIQKKQLSLHLTGEKTLNWIMPKIKKKKRNLEECYREMSLVPFGELCLFGANICTVAQTGKPEPSCDHIQQHRQRHRDLYSKVWFVTNIRSNIQQEGAGNWLYSQYEYQT